MRLYKRNVVVQIGDAESAFEIERLFIQFELKKTLSSTPTEGFVKIYNLNESTASNIEQNSDRIRLFAGYDGRKDLLFDGDVRKPGIKRINEAVNDILMIPLGGNINKITNAFFNKSYTGAVPIRTIVSDALESFGMSGVGVNNIPTFNLNDYSFTGKTGDMLNEVLNPINVQWFEDSGFIKFSIQGVTSETAVLIKEGAGLLESPLKTDKGVNFKSLLNGQIAINNKVQLESELINGVYKVIQLAHRGDNWAGDFFTECLTVT